MSLVIRLSPWNWRLKYYDKGKETISSPNEIINILLQGESKNSGENIGYEKLIERMIQIKQELKTEIEASKRREKAIEGFPVRATYIIKEIYDELAKSGENGEKLAILIDRYGLWRSRSIISLDSL